MHSVRRHRRFCAALLTCVLLTASLPGLAASTTLKLGSRGTAVLQLQQALIALGYDYEQRTRARKPPEYWPTLPVRTPRG